MADADLIVKMTVVDEVTPALKRIRRQLWWMRADQWWFQNGDDILLMLIVFVAFMTGLFLGAVVS